MRRVKEGIYQRPSGKYVVPIYDPVSGTKRYALPGVPRGGFDTFEQAKDFKRRTERDRQRLGSTRETCDQFAKRWPDDYPRPDIGTNDHHRERVKAFARDFPGVPLAEVSRPRAREWALAHPGHAKIIRAMFSDAVRDGLVGSNPFARLGLPEAKGRSDILVLTDRELGALARTAEEVWEDYGSNVFGPMVLVAACTGMRPGELYALKWSVIDFERDEIHVRRQLQTKTGKEKEPKGEKRRTLHLLTETALALKLIPRRTEHDYVFWNQSGNQFNQRVHHYYWNPVRKAFWAKLPDARKDEIDPGFDFYELRHYFGSMLAADGNSPYDIADQMGHKDGGQLAMERYIHTRSEEARERIKDRARERQLPGWAAEKVAG